ncbi:hypothetical protein PUNSTDRAFT_134631 [Punctularia strigosozonata HHB-11173 SS5]|uniref:uncharacterized protein n=1 Tax=Punctularia strigosozonata (strain HHB-11173) TaxID=741275 RepID=UPI0004417358|nr:uncharacterized protein PUNSTDRAFT_134631 [Punctularia strigosozonata HHB-11173 SS5]EIN08240.1 hypothetical protein PUNSTDRAFT_134631 [Punctularia strigosozonata HHB-11173 SS5]
MALPQHYPKRPPSPSDGGLFHHRTLLRPLSPRGMRFALLGLLTFLLLVAWAHQQQTFLSTDLLPPFLRSSSTSQTALSPAFAPLQPPAFKPAHSNAFYRLFSPPPPCAASTAIRPVPSHAQITVECLDAWIAAGTWSGPCTRLRVTEPRIDVIWTWVNGSDPLHAAARAEHAAEQPKDAGRLGAMNAQAGALKQYREHGELLYSMRSVRDATRDWAASRWHLVTNSYDAPEGAELGERDKRLGQVPQWMDLHLAETQGVTFHHDADIFKPLPQSPDAELSDRDIAAWRAAVLPTFDSMAVESQLANLPPAAVSDSALLMMDDTFLLLPLPLSAFHTPLSGPVLRMQPDLLVHPLPTTPAPTPQNPSPKTPAPLPPASGEWRGLGSAASHLSARFGARGRPYLAHFSRALNLAVLAEAAAAFPRAFDAAARARFRGMSDAEPEAHTLWLASHFVVERHREALLWSWVVGKWGGRRGALSSAVKAAMWAELGGGEDAEGEEIAVGLPVRRSKDEMRKALRRAALEPPEPEDKADEEGAPPERGTTHYAFLSADGYPYTYLDMPRRFPGWASDNGWAEMGPRASEEDEKRRPGEVCRISREECLGGADEGAQEAFVRVLRDRPQCGDCIVTALVGKSGATGLEAFLPPSDSDSDSASEDESAGTAPPPDETPEVAHLPLALHPTTAFRPARPRAFALRLLQRYAFALGSSPSRFFGVTSGANADAHFKKLERDRDVALLCVNDDVANADKVRGVEEVLNAWWGRRWGERMEFEM